MKNSKKNKLIKSGWQVGDVKAFLNLSDEDVALIEIKHRLAKLVREKRGDKKITQVALAELLSSSQSRVAKLEKGSLDVSLDLIVRALFSMGISNKELGKIIAYG